MIGLTPAPPKVRGTFVAEEYNDVPGDELWHDVLNKTGSHGKLCFVKSLFTTTDGKIRITIDDVLSNEATITQGTINYITLSASTTTILNIEEVVSEAYLFFEYAENLRIEIKQTNGANNMRCQVASQVD